jgi:hypothetical protein
MKIITTILMSLLLSISLNTFADIVVDMPKSFLKEELVEVVTNNKSSIDQYCQMSLEQPSLFSNDKKQYQACLLYKQLKQASLSYPTDQELKDYFKLSRKKQKLIVDHFVYQLIFKIDKVMTPKTAQIINYYVSGLKKKAKLTTQTLRPIDKIMLGLYPWEQKRWPGHKLLTIDLTFPKSIGLNIEYNLKPLMNIIGSNKSITITPVGPDQKTLITTYDYIKGYFTDLQSGRLPAASDDYYSRRLNTVNLEIFLLKRMLAKKEDIILKLKLKKLLEQRSQLQSY